MNVHRPKNIHLNIVIKVRFMPAKLGKGDKGEDASRC